MFCNVTRFQQLEKKYIGKYIKFIMCLCKIIAQLKYANITYIGAEKII